MICHCYGLLIKTALLVYLCVWICTTSHVTFSQWGQLFWLFTGYDNQSHLLGCVCVLGGSSPVNIPAKIRLQELNDHRESYHLNHPGPKFIKWPQTEWLCGLLSFWASCCCRICKSFLSMFVLRGQLWHHPSILQPLAMLLLNKFGTLITLIMAAIQ